MIFNRIIFSALYLELKMLYFDICFHSFKTLQWSGYRLQISRHLWHFFLQLFIRRVRICHWVHGTLPNWLYNLLLCEKINGNLRPFMEKTEKNESEITSGTSQMINNSLGPLFNNPPPSPHRLRGLISSWATAIKTQSAWECDG